MAFALPFPVIKDLMDKYDLKYQPDYPTYPLGKGVDRAWRQSKRALSQRSRSNRRKAKRCK